MNIITLKVVKITAYVEDYCAVLAFASDVTAEPDHYLILSRETSELVGGNGVSEPDWALEIQFNGEINQLKAYQMINAQRIHFFFDENVLLDVELPITHDIDIQYWVNFIFENTEVIEKS